MASERVSDEQIESFLKHHTGQYERIALDLRDARKEIARLKTNLRSVTWTPTELHAENKRLTDQRDALREAALSVASEVSGDHHLASSAYELMEDALAALAKIEGEQR